MKISNGPAQPRTIFRLRSAGAAIAALAAATTLAACGGSSSSSSTSGTSTSGGSTSAAAGGAAGNSKFVSCMKEHGVTISGRFGGGQRPTGTGTFTRPTGTMTGAAPSGGTPTGTGTMPTGTRPGGFAGGSAKEQTAFKACSKYMTGGFRRGFGGGAGAGGHATFSAATLKSFVACVRKNGYPEMPEASTTTTSGGGFFPKSIESNAKFIAASRKCESLLRPSGTGGGTPPSGTGTSTTSAS